MWCLHGVHDAVSIVGSHWRMLHNTQDHTMRSACSYLSPSHSFSLHHMPHSLEVCMNLGLTIGQSMATMIVSNDMKPTDVPRWPHCSFRSMQRRSWVSPSMSFSRYLGCPPAP